jgi:branched-chain amino acid transport system ATP-binding protein
MSLTIRDVTKSFGGLRVVDGVSFTVESSGLVGLIGPNGAGKSTLFAVVSGFERADSGGVEFAGKPLGETSPEARARSGLGRTFQVPRPFAHLTVRENLAVGAPNQPGETLFNIFARPGMVRAHDGRVLARAEEIIAFLNLGAVAGLSAGLLSGGQRKLLELGRALMMEPKFMLLDEPFAGVNAVLIEEISERIKAANANGIGFLVVEHNLTALSRLTDRLLVMDRGRLIAEGTPDNVFSDKRVQDAYVGGAT